MRHVLNSHVDICGVSGASDRGLIEGKLGKGAFVTKRFHCAGTQR
jgi:hypothetical protein